MVLQSLQRMCSVTICRCPGGILRRLEPLERIYGRCVPSADPVASLVPAVSINENQLLITNQYNQYNQLSVID